MSAKKGGSARKRPVSGKKVKKKEEAEDPSIVELRATNEGLQKENAALKESVNHYHNRLQTIVQHILDVNAENNKQTSHLDLAVVDIPESEVTRMIRNFTAAPSNILHNYEVRLEDLETRLTQLSSELAKLLKLKLKVEKGLKDLQRLHTVEDLKVNAKMLWYHSCSTHVFAMPSATNQDVNVNGFIQSSLREMSCRPTSAAVEQDKNVDVMQEPIPAHYLGALTPRAQSIILTPGDSDIEDLEPPDKKMPGETHLFNMHTCLRGLVIRELSKQRGNANDWRLMATRVGIPDSLIDQWIRMRAPNAMALVMRVWGDSTGATVRMLHRHLVSPQMRAVVLAKRVSDFYEVD